ncbi:hypothetical protein DPEC_G00020880 [Dallia pectoralis]|uniref:Uncharacterized protein n=1 Tax=Dallia pectoralis TaxID=75939 RepID=A0ACC2HGX5_DALPE|nr:hypothetical protein DPEC_G00020880 [Dallia pectoralis]
MENGVRTLEIRYWCLHPSVVPVSEPVKSGQPEPESVPSGVQDPEQDESSLLEPKRSVPATTPDHQMLSFCMHSLSASLNTSPDLYNRLPTATINAHSQAQICFSTTSRPAHVSAKTTSFSVSLTDTLPTSTPDPFSSPSQDFAPVSHVHLSCFPQVMSVSVIPPVCPWSTQVVVTSKYFLSSLP